MTFSKTGLSSLYRFAVIFQVLISAYDYVNSNAAAYELCITLYVLLLLLKMVDSIRSVRGVI